MSKETHSPAYKIYWLHPDELKSAEVFWIKHSQKVKFPLEYDRLSKGLALPTKSHIIKLNPYFDLKLSCIRVGGRLKNSLLLPDHKNPFIISSRSHFSELIIQDRHRNVLHAGTQLILALIRKSYWIINGRRAVKSFISKCIPCIRYRAATLTQQMEDLPAPRVIPSYPFLHVGLDYAGPIKFKVSPGRGRKSMPGYIAVFVCFATKAINLELVSSYDSKGFIQAFKRFVSRRGLCAHIYSDCGTNFVGASAIFKEMFSKRSSNVKEIIKQLGNQGIEWHFNPPAAPHFGGLWESAVRSTKYHLKRVIGDTILTFEEMTTLLCSIEACLNSRPLCPLTDDPTDVNALTPAHFLIGRTLLSLPEETTEYINVNRIERWKLTTKIRDDFWKIWRNQYLSNLQTRSKWSQRVSNVKEGALVLVKHENTSAAHWPLARIIKIHPGSDGIVRAVTLKTATSQLQRPIVKLIPLPVDTSN